MLPGSTIRTMHLNKCQTYILCILFCIICFHSANLPFSSVCVDSLASIQAATSFLRINFALRPTTLSPQANGEFHLGIQLKDLCSANNLNFISFEVDFFLFPCFLKFAAIDKFCSIGKLTSVTLYDLWIHEHDQYVHKNIFDMFLNLNSLISGIFSKLF